MDSMQEGLAALAGQQEVAEVWYPAKFSHRHPTRRIVVFKLVDDSQYGLFAWARDDGGYPPIIRKGHRAAVQIKQNPIRVNGSLYGFQALAVRLKP